MYKIFNVRQDDGTLLSFYQKVPTEENKLLTAECFGHDRRHIKDAVEEGYFHGYYIRPAFLFDKRVTTCRYCIIPEGSHYIIGTDNEICANKMTVMPKDYHPETELWKLPLEILNDVLSQFGLTEEERTDPFSYGSLLLRIMIADKNVCHFLINPFDIKSWETLLGDSFDEALKNPFLELIGFMAGKDVDNNRYVFNTLRTASKSLETFTLDTGPTSRYLFENDENCPLTKKAFPRSRVIRPTISFINDLTYYLGYKYRIIEETNFTYPSYFSYIPEANIKKPDFDWKNFGFEKVKKEGGPTVYALSNGNPQEK